MHGVTLVPTSGLDTYDLMRHDHLMLSKEAALKLSRGLSATKSEAPPTGEASIAPAAKPAPAEKAPVKASAKPKAAAKPAAKKPAAKAEKKAKPAAKPKAKKG
jgi:hypothetical protein